MPRQQPTEIDREIGARVAALRKEKGLSQTALGEALGVTFQQMQKYEKGTNRLTFDRVRILAELFKIPIGMLMGQASPDAVPMLDSLAVPGAIEAVHAYCAIDENDRQMAVDVLRAMRARAGRA